MRTLDYFKSRAWVDEATGCWNWQQHRNLRGYGRFLDTDRRTKGAHRGAWEAVHGPIPEGMHICHHCDNPQCVNPEHLFLGTRSDNMQDMVSKGRGHQLRGSTIGTSKLTEHDVSIIKMLLGLGVRSRKLSALYDVSKSCIGFIKTGHHWPHVTPQSLPRTE